MESRPVPSNPWAIPAHDHFKYHDARDNRQVSIQDFFGASTCAKTKPIAKKIAKEKSTLCLPDIKCFFIAKTAPVHSPCPATKDYTAKGHKFIEYN